MTDFAVIEYHFCDDGHIGSSSDHFVDFQAAKSYFSEQVLSKYVLFAQLIKKSMTKGMVPYVYCFVSEETTHRSILREIKLIPSE